MGCGSAVMGACTTVPNTLPSSNTPASTSPTTNTTSLTPISTPLFDSSCVRTALALGLGQPPCFHVRCAAAYSYASHMSGRTAAHRWGHGLRNCRSRFPCPRDWTAPSNEWGSPTHWGWCWRHGCCERSLCRGAPAAGARVGHSSGNPARSLPATGQLPQPMGRSPYLYPPPL